jgi:site-specific recombinase XerC
VRAPTAVDYESPTLGLLHQFEGLPTAARDSGNQFDFALLAMLGLLGLRISEACRSDINDIGKEHGHRMLRVLGKGSKTALVSLLRQWDARWIAPSPTDRRAILLNQRGRMVDSHCATTTQTARRSIISSVVTEDAAAYVRRHPARRGSRRVRGTDHRVVSWLLRG